MNSPASSPELQLHWSGATDIGRVREDNEDAFLSLTFNSDELRYLGKQGQGGLEQGDYVFAVSDGMGGEKAGEYASRLVVDSITKLLPPAYELPTRYKEANYKPILQSLVRQTHRALISHSRAYEEVEGMGATLSLCWFMPGWLAFVHVGDSRIYHLPHDGKLHQLTEDQGPVGMLRRSGKINELEARVHPQRNLLYQILGGKNHSSEITPQLGSVRYDPGDRFLICSDGLNEGIWDRRLEEMLREPQVNAEQLVQHAVAESGRDNTTAIFIEIKEPEISAT